MVEGIDGVSTSTEKDDEEGGTDSIRGTEPLDDLLEELSTSEGIEGINVEVEGQEPIAIARRLRILEAERQTRRTLEERQLEQLEEIQDTTEILKIIASRLSVLESTLEPILDATMATQDGIEAQNSLIIKDSDEIDISNSKQRRDVVDEDNVLTSFVDVKADPQNDGALYISDSTVTINGGLKLEAGEDKRFPVNILARDFQIVAEEDDETYSYTAYGPQIQ